MQNHLERTTVMAVEAAIELMLLFGMLILALLSFVLTLINNKDKK
ncbi:putative holin-like toxin [Streptococcus danieliae]|uniref:Putative holin-like toxin n=1 Tax=Streptococcus danieliae TaxID=747656 RepID=A0A7Z0M5Z2_9STRE|nr:putative holin-like toxin [Streptococcus danieliae]MBF0699281.1 putative holin-like toxin [Streptococcus danieliae]NYS96457.1 putative holin-like toxin [Streptococcus danieliae]